MFHQNSCHRHFFQIRRQACSWYRDVCINCGHVTDSPGSSDSCVHGHSTQGHYGPWHGELLYITHYVTTCSYHWQAWKVIFFFNYFFHDIIFWNDILLFSHILSKVEKYSSKVEFLSIGKTHLTWPYSKTRPYSKYEWKLFSCSVALFLGPSRRGAFYGLYLFFFSISFSPRKVSTCLVS